jgi:ADP-dependent NAD(P)H-hydrate dehydratase / NAD(P)H-hydrate epimerase
MLRVHSTDQIRRAEGVLLERTPRGALMQRAAAGLARECLVLLRRRRGKATGARAVLLVGAGNNGGDALWAGARMRARGVDVTAVLTAPRCHGAGLAALRSAGGRILRCPHDPGGPGVGTGGQSGAGGLAAALGAVARADLVVDGLVGLGGRSGLREPAATLVGAVPSGTPTVAVDLPSGVDPDTGRTPTGHVRAHTTVTFGALKPCLLLPPAARAAGRVVVVDLGLEPWLDLDEALTSLETADLARLWPVPGPQDDKYTRGVLGVVAGSVTYPGAAVLAVRGAVNSGAGLVRHHGPRAVTDLVRAACPEAVTVPGRVDAWALGSGVDPSVQDGQVRAVTESLVSGLPCVVDAGALPILAARVARGEPCGPGTLLTPHPGELARLLHALSDTAVTRSQVLTDPLGHARLAARLTGACVLLKGSTTLLASPDGRVRVQSGAPAWLATAGSGDVLAGIAGTLLASGLDPLDAGAIAAAVHGRAALRASGAGTVPSGPDGPVTADGPVMVGGPVTAGAVADAIGATVGQILGRAVRPPGGNMSGHAGSAVEDPGSGR